MSDEFSVKRKILDHLYNAFAPLYDGEMNPSLPLQGPGGFGFVSLGDMTRILQNTFTNVVFSPGQKYPGVINVSDLASFIGDQMEAFVLAKLQKQLKSKNLKVWTEIGTAAGIPMPTIAILNAVVVNANVTAGTKFLGITNVGELIWVLLSRSLD